MEKQSSFFMRTNHPYGIHDDAQLWLTGVRGLVAISSFLHGFLATFLPATVFDKASGPAYQVLIRDVLSPLLWNESLNCSALVLLSGRTLPLPFLLSPTRSQLAGSIFRRPFRLAPPLLVALALSALLFSLLGTSHVARFAAQTSNDSVSAPRALPRGVDGALAFFNSAFVLFWVNKPPYAQQAASLAFPGRLLWPLSILYQQSYTVYTAALVLPYVRSAWRVKGLLLFVLSAWWVQSWAWYSVTGLLLADASLNMSLAERLRRGLPLPVRGLLGRHAEAKKNVGYDMRIPGWATAAALLVAGVVMQYVWTAWRPELRDVELMGHTAVYYSGGLGRAAHDRDEKREPQARDDNYVLLLGALLLMEAYGGLQRVAANRVCVYLGRRSLALFLMQSIVMYTAGIKLFLVLTNSRGLSAEAATGVCFVVCLLVSGLAAEIFYRAVDYPSQMLPRRLWEWMKRV